MSPEQLLAEIRRADRRRAYARSHPLLLTIACAAIVGGVSFLTTPGILAQSSLGVFPLPLRVVWTISYVIGGGLVVVGVLTFGRRVLRPAQYEVAGCCLLSSCFLVYSIAIFARRGWGPGAAAASVFAGLCIGLAIRAWTIVTERSLPWANRA